MYGKFFASTFTGSMVGAGANVFAVWGYVIANTRADNYVELNPPILAAMIGCPVSEVEAAIAYLCAADVRSRSKKHDGARLVQEAPFLYLVPNHQDYRGIRDENDRRAYMQKYMKGYRATAKAPAEEDVNCLRKQSKPPLAHTDTDTDTDTEEDKTLSTSSTDVQQVFDYWREVMGHPKAVLDRGRSTLIAARLRERSGSVEDLTYAIDGCKASPHHMGRNDTGKVHDGIKLIFRSNDDVERFMSYNKSVPKGKLETFSEPALDVEPGCSECFDTGEVLRPKPGGADWEMETVPCPECAGEKI